jgi:hypothetical protein
MTRSEQDRFNEYRRNRYKTNLIAREHEKLYKRRYYKNNEKYRLNKIEQAMETYNFYLNKAFDYTKKPKRCCCCGSIRYGELMLYPRRPEEKRYNITDILSEYYDKIGILEEESEKCVIVCHNCYNQIIAEKRWIPMFTPDEISMILHRIFNNKETTRIVARDMGCSVREIRHIIRGKRYKNITGL